MTKQREPLSIEAALSDVIDAIGIDAAAEVTGRKPAYLRGLSDPGKRERLTCDDAIALDAAYHSVIGGRPIYEMMGAKLDARVTAAQSCADQLLDCTIDAIRESGDAAAALLEASRPGATLAKKRLAMREVLQSVAAKRRTIPILRAMLKNAAQPP